MSTLLSHKSIRVKKPTHGHQPNKVSGEVGPVDVLIDRSQQWKHVTKSLLHYYQGLADIETSTAKSTLALVDTIQVPFHEGHHFLGEGGWQEVLYEVRDKTKILADHHSALSATLEKTVVQELEGVRAELKAHIAAIEKEAGVLAVEVDKERTTSADRLTALQSGIETFEQSSTHMMAANDPYITHRLTATQLKKQVIKENSLQAALIRFQQQQPSFEIGIAKSIQSACVLYDEAKKLQEAGIAQVEQEIALALQRVEPDAEYKFYAGHDGAVLDPNTPFRDLDAITFPGHNHAATVSIKEGPLERKKRFTKAYKESYYVLTPSGYLHERKSNDDENAIKPVFSLFLPECSLGPPAKESDKSHKFHVEGNKAVKSSFEGKMKASLRFGGKEIAYSFRARTHTEMMGWWNAMDTLSRDTKTANSAVGKAVEISPILAAVMNVGYAEPAKEEVAEVKGEEIAPVGPTAVAADTPATSAVVAAPAPAEHAAIEAREAEEEEEEEEEYEEYEDDDEEGGSSAEEEELARTAPSTPAVQGGTTDPLDVAPATTDAHAVAETLPSYTGDGTAAPDKAVIAEKAKPGFLGSIFGSSAASTSE